MKKWLWMLISITCLIFGGTPAHASGLGDDLLDAVIGNENQTAVSLLDRGADVNAREPDGWTPLHFAVYNRNFELAKVLIQKGGDINARDFHAGNTVLMFAVASGDAEFVKYLISKGVDVNARQKAGNTALSYAYSYQSPQIVQILKTAGAK